MHMQGNYKSPNSSKKKENSKTWVSKALVSKEEKTWQEEEVLGWINYEIQALIQSTFPVTWNCFISETTSAEIETEWKNAFGKLALKRRIL